MSRSGVEQRLRVTIAKASLRCPSLLERAISPHTVRHATATHLLQSGVDITVIAMWLGHELCFDAAVTTHPHSREFQPHRRSNHCRDVLVTVQAN